MIKITARILLVFLFFSIGTFCFAYGVQNNENITVIYQENSTLTNSQKEQFENLLISEQSDHETYSLLCLLGHDKVTEYAHVIKHKALSVAPRCANQLYEVITCTRCDYMDATLVSQLFIDCCPED